MPDHNDDTDPDIDGAFVAIVVENLIARLPNELDLKRNERVTVIGVVDQDYDWCTVETEDGRRGICPRRFLTVDNEEHPGAVLQDRPLL